MMPQVPRTHTMPTRFCIYGETVIFLAPATKGATPHTLNAPLCQEVVGILCRWKSTAGKGQRNSSMSRKRGCPYVI